MINTNNIYEELQKRAEEGKIIRLGMIGLWANPFAVFGMIFGGFCPLLRN